jgi:hypothetical protein
MLVRMQEKGDALHTAGGNLNLCNHMEISMEDPQKTKNRTST